MKSYAYRQTVPTASSLPNVLTSRIVKAHIVKPTGIPGEYEVIHWAYPLALTMW